MNQRFTYTILPLSIPFADIYTFSAKEKDSETGLSYFGSRYYSSEMNYIDSGRSDGQTPIHEFLHNLGAVDTQVNGTRIMDYNHQVNGEPVPIRKVQMEDIETLINQSNSRLGIVYEN